MKLYAVRDEKDERAGDLAWLFYDVASGRFYIELPDHASEWVLPPLGSFAKRGVYSISSEWSMKWVAQRIVPPDRQNLGMILKDNGLKFYDPHRLLVLGEGRCAQDDCYITEITEEELPEPIHRRLLKKVADVVPLHGQRVIVCFRNNQTRLIDLKPFLRENEPFAPVERDTDLFMRVRVSPLGSGIEWDEPRHFPAERLYRMGRVLPLTLEDLAMFTIHRTIDTTEMENLLSCSRQRIKQLADEGKFHPIRTGSNHTLFPRREAEAYKRMN